MSTFEKIARMYVGEIKVFDPGFRNITKTWWAICYLLNHGLEYTVEANQYNGIIVRRVK